MLKRPRRQKGKFNKIFKPKAQTITITIADDQSFDDFRDSGEWEDFSLPEKQKCYDLNQRKITFQAQISLNQTTKQKNVNIVSAKTPSGLFNPKVKHIREKNLNLNRTANLPTLITTQDFEECGKVANYLKLHPNASDYEIAAITKLSPYPESQA